MARVFGLSAAIKFQKSKAWNYPGAVPGFNTASELIRAVASVALLALNFLAGCFYSLCCCCTGPIEEKKLHFKAAKLHAMMIPYALFAAIPVVGNIPVWKKKSYAEWVIFG